MQKGQAPGYYRMMLGDFEVIIQFDTDSKAAAAQRKSAPRSRVTASCR